MSTAAKQGIPGRLQAFVCALICAAVAVLPTTSQSQVVDPQAQGLVLKAEAASLCALVGKMQVIAFSYGYDPVSAEPRELEPYAVGYSRQRNVLLFGRQVKGYSKSATNSAEALPGWRNFRIDKIARGVVNARVSTFDPVRPDPGEHRYISEFVCKNEFVD
jgi:hypothetical protein